MFQIMIKQEPVEDKCLQSVDEAFTAVVAPPADKHVLERIILLHPGPFVTERILRHRCASLKPSSEHALYAMNTLQRYYLGQIHTVTPGNLKVFYKATPHDCLEDPLSALGVRLVDYQLMFSERDPKLEDTLHDQLKLVCPKPDDMLPLFYKY